MRLPTAALFASAALALAAAPASAQLRILLADRDSDTIWALTDRNSDGVIDEVSEISVFYSAANAAGSPAPLNPNAIGVTSGGSVLVGDQDAASRHWLVLRDLDRDGNAHGAGESNIGVGPGNPLGASFAAPAGFAQHPDGGVFLCNAGNASGPDQIWLANDNNDDNDAMDDGELLGYVTINGFGTNGAFSPQEIAVGADGALFLRNSSAAGQGIFRLADNNSNSLIDDPAEFTLFWGAGNAAGTPATAGFALEIDPMRPRAFYTLQLATGGIDQLVRAIDLNNDNDAMDADESDIVFSTAETGFTSVDALALPDGRVLISDNSGNRIISLVDTDGDGRFTSDGERSNFLSNASGRITAARGMALFPCPADFNGDFQTNPDDLADFVTCFFLDIAFPNSCPASEFNNDGFRDPDDLADFITAFFTPC